MLLRLADRCEVHQAPSLEFLNKPSAPSSGLPGTHPGTPRLPSRQCEDHNLLFRTHSHSVPPLTTSTSNPGLELDTCLSQDRNCLKGGSHLGPHSPRSIFTGAPGSSILNALCFPGAQFQATSSPAPSLPPLTYTLPLPAQSQPVMEGHGHSLQRIWQLTRLG